MLRKLTTFAFLVGWGALSASAAATVEIGDDGLHKQDWFAVTFRDIAEDIEIARDEGKRLAMIFEQRGCIHLSRGARTALSERALIPAKKTRTSSISGGFRMARFAMGELRPHVTSDIALHREGSIIVQCEPRSRRCDFRIAGKLS